MKTRNKSRTPATDEEMAKIWKFIISKIKDEEMANIKLRGGKINLNENKEP